MMTLAEDLRTFKGAVKNFRNIFIWHLPGQVHEVILCLTGFRVVQITEVDPYGGEGEVSYRWTDEYPLKSSGGL